MGTRQINPLRATLLATLALIGMVAVPASATPGAATRGLRRLPPPRVQPLAAPRAPAEPKSGHGPTSACVGLAGYEIVRAPGAVAACSPGNRVLGGTCTGIGGGAPDADGSAWECAPGELALAICAAICSEAPPRTGACCIDGECSELTAGECSDQGGAYLGDDSECAEETCAPRGACCVEDDRQCVDDLTPGECADEGGDHVGDDTTCDSDEAAACFE